MVTKRKTDYLNGHFLIAMPTLDEGPFARTVVYVCSHSADGAMGITINQAAPDITFEEVLVHLELIPDEPDPYLPESARDMVVHRGGPVETGRGFVLHSREFHIETLTMPIDENISLTTTRDILKAISRGIGPRHSLLALGYAGWAPGQLDNEILENSWLHCPADPALVFDTDIDTKYERALSLIGIDPTHLSAEAGHA